MVRLDSLGVSIEVARELFEEVTKELVVEVDKDAVEEVGAGVGGYDAADEVSKIWESKPPVEFFSKSFKIDKIAS